MSKTVQEQRITPSILEWKEPIVKSITQDIKGSRTIAVVDLVDLPSRQLQEIRTKIKGKINVRVTRKRLIKRALENSGTKGASELIESMQGMSALLSSDMDSFDLFKLLKANMSDSHAKAGQTTPFDIKVKAGPTPFSPGPILSELGEVGLKSAIEGGKVIIKEDAVVVKAGEKVSAKAASILSRLDIKPIKVGLNIIATLEDGKLMDRSVLDINEEEYIQNITLAHSEAIRLAIAQSILTKDTSELLVQNAERDAIALARSQDILTDKTVGEIMAKVERSALAIKSDVDSHQLSSEQSSVDKKEPEQPKEENKQVGTPSEESKGAQE